MERIKILSAALFLVAMAGFCDEVLTKDERVIALTLLGEARGEGKIGLSAVACVIQRRAWEKNINILVMGLHMINMYKQYYKNIINIHMKLIKN